MIRICIILFIFTNFAFGASYIEGFNLLKNGDEAQAYKLLEEAIQRNKDHKIKLMIANVLAFAPQKYLKHNSLTYGLLALENENLKGIELGPLNLKVADLAFSQNKLEIAKIHYEKALKYRKYINEGYTRYQFSWVLANLHNYKYALSNIEKGLSLGKGEFDAPLSEVYGQFLGEAIVFNKLGVNPVPKLIKDKEMFSAGLLRVAKNLRYSKQFKRYLSFIEKSQVTTLPLQLIENLKRKPFYTYICKNPHLLKIEIQNKHMNFVKKCRNKNMKKLIRNNNFLLAHFYGKEHRQFCPRLLSFSVNSIDSLLSRDLILNSSKCGKNLTEQHVKYILASDLDNLLKQEVIKSFAMTETGGNAILNQERQEILKINPETLNYIATNEKLDLESRVNLFEILNKEFQKNDYENYLRMISKLDQNKFEDKFNRYLLSVLKKSKSKQLILLSKQSFFAKGIENVNLNQLYLELTEADRKSNIQVYLSELIKNNKKDEVILNFSEYKNLIVKNNQLYRNLFLSDEMYNAKALEDEDIFVLRDKIVQNHKLTRAENTVLRSFKLNEVIKVKQKIVNLNLKIKNKEFSNPNKILSWLKKIKYLKKQVEISLSEHNWITKIVLDEFNLLIEESSKKISENEEYNELAQEIMQWKLEIG